MAGLEVSGRRFQTEADYKAALRDQAKIEKIRARVIRRTVFFPLRRRRNRC